ncbi:MAG: glutathione-disulfide reductase [Rhodospirillales bacterium]|jgi:glutathione reductase (NADPH)|nr:glutathione-disulfide reductase [Rhodospirillales bacterium]
MPKYDYDMITIGAGSGGVRASRLAGGYGARSAMVEADRVGGTCVLRGCIPKKLLIYGAHYADHLEDAVNYGWTIEDAHHDWRTLIDNKNAELDRLNGIYLRILRDNNVDLYEGRGVLVDPHTVEVDGKPITSENILIAVGGWPSTPDIPGIEHVISSNEALELPELPGRMVIVGGGYIAVEFAGVFAGLGTEVTEIVRADTVLRGFDEDIRVALDEELVKRGINLMSETVVESIEKQGDIYSLRLRSGEMIESDCVMYATGRSPNTRGLGLIEAGVKLKDNGAIEVDQWNRTNVPNIYAVGDVTDRVQLTPVAIQEGRAVAETLFNDNPMTIDYADIATAVFSTPPIGTVGLTEAEAHERGHKIDIYDSRFKPLVHTLSGRQERAYMKLVVDAETDRVLGVHMMGMDAPEIIQGFAIALKCKATKAQFDATTGIHPSAAEEFVTMSSKRIEPDAAKAAE